MRRDPLGSRERSGGGGADFVPRSDALTLQVELGKVFRSAVADSPFPVFNSECGAFLFTFFAALSWCFLCGRLISFTFLSSSFLNYLRRLLWLSEFLVFYLILVDVFLFSFELQPDDALHLADVFLNHK